MKLQDKKAHFEENQTSPRPNRKLYDLFFQRTQEYKSLYAKHKKEESIS